MVQGWRLRAQCWGFQVQGSAFMVCGVRS